MQCEQIRSILGEYADGSLPGYKAAWVVQHLAGCDACTEAAHAARSTSHRPARPSLPQRAEPSGEEPRLEDIQRPVPRWLRLATVLLIVAAAGGAVWLFFGNPAAPAGPARHHAASDQTGRPGSSYPTT